MKILLTGGAGYIGSHVSHLLIDDGNEVTIIDSLITGHKVLIPKKAKFENCDIADDKKITEIINRDKFDLVMHFAGLIRVDESLKEPEKYNEYNYIKAKRFLNTCIKNNLNNIIFSSTASVYGESDNKKVSEKDKLNPLNPYAKSKLKLEKFIIDKSNQENINYIILRYFIVAGADNKLRTGLISNFSTHLIKVACEVAVGIKNELIINGNDYKTPDGTPVRDYIHVTDLADIHLIAAKHLLKTKSSHIFNCGYGKGYSVMEVVKAFSKFLNKEIKHKFGPRREGDSQMIVANVDKFDEFFSWKPKFNNLEQIIKTAFEWEKKLNNTK